MRSRIRIQDGRAKPIDLLAKYASSAEEGAEDLSGVEMHEPYTYLNGLTIRDLEDLLEDIKVYMELEQGRDWGCGIVVVFCNSEFMLRNCCNVPTGNISLPIVMAQSHVNFLKKKKKSLKSALCWCPGHAWYLI